MTEREDKDRTIRDLFDHPAHIYMDDPRPLDERWLDRAEAEKAEAEGTALFAYRWAIKQGIAKETAEEFGQFSAKQFAGRNDDYPDQETAYAWFVQHKEIQERTRTIHPGTRTMTEPAKANSGRLGASNAFTRLVKALGEATASNIAVGAAKNKAAGRDYNDGVLSKEAGRLFIDWNPQVGNPDGDRLTVARIGNEGNIEYPYGPEQRDPDGFCDWANALSKQLEGSDIEYVIPSLSSQIKGRELP